MLNVVLSNDIKKLERQIEALKWQLQQPDIPEKDRKIFEKTLKEMEEYRKKQ